MNMQHTLMYPISSMLMTLRNACAGSASNMVTHFFTAPSCASASDAPANGAMAQPEKRSTQFIVALTLAVLATLTSLCIAAYAGWQRGGLVVERAIMITLGGVAVLFVHLLPVGWRMLRVPARVCASALWCVGIVVVLYAQVSFFMVSHLHASDQRASTVPVTVVPSSVSLPQGRTLTEIAREVAKISTDLAKANVRRCTGDCPTLKVHRIILAAQLAALNTEAGEAKRREAEQDRRNEQADRNEASRATLRADPVASPAASWIGTTESRFELMLAVACAVVLEGAAILGWTFVTVAWGCDAGRSVIVRDYAHGAPEPDSATEGEPRRAVMSEEDQLLDRIRTAVVAGKLKPTQNSIRNFLRCGQPKAGKLNRLYLEKFGSMQGLATTHRQNVVLTRLSTGEIK